MHWDFTNVMFPGIILETMGICDERRIVWQLTCGVLTHITIKSVRAVTRNPNGLECSRCGASCDSGRVTGGSSSHERAAWEALRELEVAWCVEVRLIPMWNGGIDIFLPWGPNDQRINLAIMVDGEGHFDEGHKIHGISIDKQHTTDREFEILAQQKRLSILRLHYKDRKRYRAYIEHAINVLVNNGKDKFPMYSWNLNIIDGKVV